MYQMNWLFGLTAVGILVVASLPVYPEDNSTLEPFEFVKKYDYVRHAPAWEWVHGTRLGNGDLGVVPYGSPEHLTFSFSKGDLWDFRVKDNRSFRPNVPFPELRRMVREGDKEDLQAGTNYQHSVSWRNSPTPIQAGEMHLSLFSGGQQWWFEETHSLATATHAQRVGVWGHIAMGNVSPHTEVLVESFVAAEAPVFVLQVAPPITLAGWTNYKRAPVGTPSLPLPYRHHLWLWRQVNMEYPRPQTGQDDGFGWFSLQLPDGLSYCLMCCVEGGQFELETTREMVIGTIEQSEDTGFAVLATIALANNPQAAVTAARAQLEAARRQGAVRLRKAHERWWRNFWNKSMVYLAESDVQQSWLYGMYLLASYSRPGHLAPGLQGVWFKQNCLPWHGDYHMGWNLSLNFWPAYVGNHLELAMPLYELYERMLPQAKKDTAQYFGMRGVKFPFAGAPTGHEIGGYFPLCVWPGSSAWVGLEFWRYYQFSQDQQFLRNRAYPMMKECMAFYEDYLSEDDTGHLEIIPSCSPERDADSPEAWDRNPSCDIGLISALLKASIQAAELLDTDTALRERWQWMLDRMPPYPTAEGHLLDTAEGKGSHATNVTIFPACEFGLQSSPSDRALAERTLEKYQGIFQADISMAAHLGMGEYAWKRIRAWAASPAALQLPRAKWASHWDNRPWDGKLGGGYPALLQIEHFGGYTAGINETLLNSHRGVMHIFPAVESDATISFRRLLAHGAFEVSAACKEGTVTKLTIRSRVGNTCQLINPWPDQDILVKEEGVTDPLRLQGDHVQFPTRAGATYQIEPAAL